MNLKSELTPPAEPVLFGYVCYLNLFFQFLAQFITGFPVLRVLPGIWVECERVLKPDLGRIV
jgi:hypothetical protein